MTVRVTDGVAWQKAHMREIPAEFIGPKMGALRDDRQRRFAWIMGCGEENRAEAARSAGYSDLHEAAKVRAHFLMQDPAVIEAIHEVARKVLSGLAPVAIAAAREILLDRKHPARPRMVETILDRTGFFAETQHKVTVEHTADVRQLEDLARRLAAETGVDARRFLGTNRSADSPVLKVIEAEVEDGSTKDA